MATRVRVQRKKRSGWKHALDINRNRRRCAKRRRSASAATRHTLERLREADVYSELEEARRDYQGLGHGRHSLRPSPGLARSRTGEGAR